MATELGVRREDFDDKWNYVELRSITILSLSLQIFLILFGSHRKTTKNIWLITLISIAHSLADFVAAYGVGIISRSQRKSEMHPMAVPAELLAFWAPFFLLHLSGSETFTSISIDDEHLWLKKLVGLVSQILAIVFIFVKSLPCHLRVPTIMVFVFGVIKNSYRIHSLLLRSHEIVRDSKLTTPDFDPVKFSEIHSEIAKANIPIAEQILRRPLPPQAKRLGKLVMGLPENGELKNFSILEYALFFYDTFKCFITNATISSDYRIWSRNFFLNLTPTDAFKLLELELYCMYEALYTISLSVSNLIVIQLRAYSIYLVAIPLILFATADKYDWNKFDIVLSYALLIWALFQEIYLYCRYVFSPQIILKIFTFSLKLTQKMFKVLPSPPDRDRFLSTLPLSLNSPLVSLLVDIFLAGRGKWSESVCQINLLALCLRYHSNLHTVAENISSFIGLKDLLEIRRLYWNVSIKSVTQDVKEIVFNELKSKSAIAKKLETARKVCSQRGDWALMRNSCYSQLSWSLGELEYGESLVLWHVATELCYNDGDIKGTGDEIDRKRSFCKILSDYMLYLLVLRPKMMVSVAGDWEEVFYDTCGHARGLFLTNSIKDLSKACQQIMKFEDLPEAIMEIGEKSKSVLVHASKLAKQLNSLQGEQWKLMSQVWVELMAYAAFNCEPYIHAQQPSEGGELLTFVWLFMNHLGIGKQVMDDGSKTK